MLEKIIIAIVLVVPIVRLIIFIYRQCLRPQKNLKKLGGNWAVVTGSTDGIGKAYAFELAKNGLNLCLVSRTEAKLKNTCEEIKEKFGEIQTSYITVDLTAPTKKDWDNLTLFFKSKDVGILINNAGIFRIEYLHLVDPETINKIISINTTSLTQLCRIAIESMVERNKGGCIVNVSSGSACLSTCPLGDVYAATKVYVQHFSRSLADSYRDKGIKVQVVSPWFVATKMVGIKQASLVTPSPETYVKAAIKHIGYETDCCPYWPHAIQTFIVGLPPRIFQASYIIKEAKKEKELKKEL
eukprot:TRINITY_DN1015_c1_g2_i1.p1 TRINITY_DN1015_c1_g2~~TRINITY_DN1015_c1_g2_i1.p1  ORF type:complete len:298 (-),score=33.99 TRINITY_DN1015_c1_g2_i1:582-1475(-)